MHQPNAPELLQLVMHQQVKHFHPMHRRQLHPENRRLEMPYRIDARQARKVEPGEAQPMKAERAEGERSAL